MGGFTLLTQVTAQPIALFKKNPWEKSKGHQWYSSFWFLLIGANVSDEIWESVRLGGCCDEYWRDPCRARGPGSTTLLFLALFFCFSLFFHQNWSTFWNSSYDQDWNLQQHFVMILSLKSDRSSFVEEAQRFKTIVLVSLSGRLHSASCEMEPTLFNFPHLSWSPRVRWPCDKEDV